MHRSSVFSDLIDATERLSLEEKEILLEVLRSRTVEERREKLKKDVAQARREHRAGKTKPTTAKHLMREISR